MVVSIHLRQIRQFYLVYSNLINSVHQFEDVQKANQWLANYPEAEERISEPTFALSWSHYLILMRVENPDTRNFYEIEISFPYREVTDRY